jgi:hypothetical protein
MHIPGHLAIGLITHRMLTLFDPAEPVPLRPLLIASLFPDVVDKSLGYVFCVMPNGRHYAHNIFALVLLGLGVWLVWGRRVGLGWLGGYGGHLLADGRKVPWLFPVKSYCFYPGHLRLKPIQLLKESVFLVVVLFVYRLSYH